MNRLPKRLTLVELTNAFVGLYVTPANTRTQIAACTVTNKTGVAQWVTIIITPSGGGTARYLTYQVVVPADSVYIAPGPIAQILEAGDTLSAEASAISSLDLAVSGYEYS